MVSLGHAGGWPGLQPVRSAGVLRRQRPDHGGMHVSALLPLPPTLPPPPLLTRCSLTVCRRGRSFRRNSAPPLPPPNTHTHPPTHTHTHPTPPQGPLLRCAAFLLLTSSLLFHGLRAPSLRMLTHPDRQVEQTRVGRYQSPAHALARAYTCTSTPQTRCHAHTHTHTPQVSAYFVGRSTELSSLPLMALWLFWLWIETLQRSYREQHQKDRGRCVSARRCLSIYIPVSL